MSMADAEIVMAVCDRNALSQGGVSSRNQRIVMQGESPGAMFSHAAMGVACEPKLWIVCRLVRVASYCAKSSAGAWCWPWVEWS